MEVYKREMLAPRIFKSVIEARGRSFIECAWYLNYLKLEFGHGAITDFFFDFP